jgi:hypothetical protein
LEQGHASQQGATLEGARARVRYATGSLPGKACGLTDAGRVHRAGKSASSSHRAARSLEAVTSGARKGAGTGAWDAWRTCSSAPVTRYTCAAARGVEGEEARVRRHPSSAAPHCSARIVRYRRAGEQPVTYAKATRTPGGDVSSRGCSRAGWEAKAPISNRRVSSVRRHTHLARGTVGRHTLSTRGERWKISLTSAPRSLSSHVHELRALLRFEEQGGEEDATTCRARSCSAARGTGGAKRRAQVPTVRGASQQRAGRAERRRACCVV